MKKISLSFLFLILASSPAISATPSFCDRVGAFTESVAENKAKGVNVSDILAAVRNQGLSEPRRKFNDGLVENIYFGPQTSRMTPGQVKAHFVRQCIKYGWQPIP
jgi:hypothetical protein